MANFSTQDEINTSTGADFILISQGGVDYKLTKANWLNTLYPVGSTLPPTSNPAHPNTLGYPGTWAEIEAGCSFNTVTAIDPALGTITGDNDPLVPVPEHNHTGTTTSNGNHIHSGTTSSHGGHYHLGWGSGSASWPYGVSGAANQLGAEGGNNNNYLYKSSTEGAHTHTYETINGGAHTHAFTSNNTGTAAATLNVQGKVLNMIVWHRTA